ncbi:leucine-rich repeat extensin-like protein 3 [Strigops habroptila]|uniref:leucine-rich repeat extensin-like protein 3 n=1 Tax=Strigops habroptila TaxID=2489341 RepID=UPI0011CF2373|nr:leucine-rich repeat extensin-like protein 3 [Strigops habroptila]
MPLHPQHLQHPPTPPLHPQWPTPRHCILPIFIHPHVIHPPATPTPPPHSHLPLSPSPPPILLPAAASPRSPPPHPSSPPAPNPGPHPCPPPLLPQPNHGGSDEFKPRPRKRRRRFRSGKRPGTGPVRSGPDGLGEPRGGRGAQPKKAGPWRSSLTDVAVRTQPSPPPAAIAMLVSPCSCSEELLAWSGVNPQLGVAAPVAME